jgi:tetratricopeptide (TPR) repeat protein
MLYAQLARLPAQEKPPEPVVVAAETAPPEVGARRHVLATRLRLRLEPREDAPVLAELRLNTAVKVESVEGPFARVVVESVPQRVVHLALAGKPPPRRAGVAATPLKGYAAWAFLAPEPARAERLLEEADAYEASGRAAEAALVLERAALLRPWETELLKRLVRVALASERYGVVAWAALQLSQAGPLASLELVFGCRGSREAAVVLRHPQWLRARGAALPADVCVSDVETGRTCEPCSEANIINTEEENAQAAEAHARELVAWSRAEREREKANAALRKQLAEGPWLRVVLEGSPVHQGAQLWVYGVTAEASGACGNPERPVRQLAHVSQEPLVVPAPGERLVAWVRVPATDGIIYGLVRAKTRTEALEEMKRAVAESSWELTADTGLPAPNIAGTLRLCVGCCGC